MEGASAAQEPTPIRNGLKKLTEEEQIANARESVRLAVAELDVAVKVAKKSAIPGWDLGAYLVAKMEPMLADIGYAQPKKLPKNRRAGA